MRKMMIVIVASLTLLQGCTTYKPVIDTNGRSGTFNEDKARMITDDLQHCKTLAKDNTNTLVESGKAVYNVWWRASTLYLSDKAPNKYKEIVKNCLEGRNHKVVY